ncbi:hypothetical protein CBW65_04210 [Tumebacillus avium]|uniref:EamA-like transporter family protein n=1 Tax=Tumebacillus avium TaxID=1903704 RepID=A0A1Y0ILG5_9BACL|nr:DMT family transporter [Tumebacillus avium]ARU60355.1 hypothetical protein CBW65_04210 [Tumebacillus avium]
MSSGLFFALLAGALVGLQNIFNSKVSERAGSWATTAWVLGMGCLASLVIGLAVEGQGMFVWQHPKPWHWVSGLLGVGVVTCLVQGVRLLGATFAVSIVLTSQLLCALMWDSFGWLGLEQVPFTGKQLLGVLVIIGGVLVFKGRGKQVEEV